MKVESQRLENINHFPSGNFEETCILMFSGGRDSTLAALRLNQQRQKLALVTVSSDHLFGINAVENRLVELSRILPLETPWYNIQQPDDLLTDTSFYERTCLPCHHAYVVIAVALAVSSNAKALALGYSGYQSDWPEQTPLAISRLQSLLDSRGIELILPVCDVQSLEETITELRKRGVTSNSLEQKCCRQIDNIALDKNTLENQITIWEKSIEDSLSKIEQIIFRVIEHHELRRYAIS